MLFEYQCSICKTVTEKLEHYSAPTVKDCEMCKSKSASHRMIARTSFMLSGSGWCRDSYSKSK